MFTLAPSSHLMVPVRMVSATLRSCSDRATSVSSAIGLASSTRLMMRLGTTFWTIFLPVVLAAGLAAEPVELVWAMAARGRARAVAAISAIVFMEMGLSGGWVSG